VRVRPRAIRPVPCLSVRAIRGPRHDGRFYWRAEVYDLTTQKRATVWTAWAVEAHVRAAFGVLAERESPAPQTRDMVRMLRSGVYLVRGGGRVKIGYSANVPHRMKCLQTGSPVALSLLAVKRGDRAREEALHTRFRRWRLHGEWFEDRPEIRAAFGVP